MRVLGTKPRPLEEEPVLLTSVPSLQLPTTPFSKYPNYTLITNRESLLETKVLCGFVLLFYCVFIYYEPESRAHKPLTTELHHQPNFILRGSKCQAC